MKTTIYEKGNRIALCATIKNIRTGTSKSGKKQVILTLEDDTPVFATDREEGRGMATRLENMKPEMGKDLIIYATKSENGNGLMANDFAYPGNRMTIKDGDDELFILTGAGEGFRTFEKGISFRLPHLRVYNSEERKNEWQRAGVTMWKDNPSYDANLSISDGEKVAVVCDRYRVSENGEYTNHEYTAMSVTVL